MAMNVSQSPLRVTEGAAVTCRRDAVPCLEGPGEVRPAAESPTGGDIRDGQVAEPLICEIVSAAAQPLLADPAAEGEAFAREEPMQLPDRDITRLGDGPG